MDSDRAGSQPPGLVAVEVGCPYCGEGLDILVDPEEAGSTYIEDCQVCCRPIVMTVHLVMDETSGEPSGVRVDARHEDEA